jgi:adenine-specific DNA-methyltransferase
MPNSTTSATIADSLTTSPSPNFDKLKAKLRELFELDKADLDFGIYRILRQRHRDITEFLDNHLEKTVTTALQSHAILQRGHVEEELREAEKAAAAAGIAPEQSPRVMELRAKLQGDFDLQGTADEVYSHLLTFFSRYYQDGDFLGLHRSTVRGREKYMLPYNGEEVKLVWANMDQYYIKSSELLRDYTFRIRKADLATGELNLNDLPDEAIVHFKLIEGDTEKDNRKPDGKTTRAFALDETQPFEVSREDVKARSGEEAARPNLTIRFRYREHPSERNLQDKLNADTLKFLADNLPPAWQFLLRAVVPSREKKDPVPLLQKHLRAYTAKHQFDYFIHKDLGGFLRRELDFYIKNEVMHLDDIEDTTAPKAEEYLSKIRAIRRCALPVIQMLAQLEDFQKKLWLKKKFVVETRYCLTLDRVPQALYPDIVACEPQWQEWEQLHAISEIAAKGHQEHKEKNTSQESLRSLRSFAAKNPDAFVAAHPHLMLDTRHFPREFTLKLLASIENLDDTLDGTCFHSENFQALQLMQERYREQVKCIYIDPPYNTGTDEFIYRDQYQHSSWLAMMYHRLALAKRFLHSFGAIFVSVDDNEQAHLRLLMDELHGENNLITSMVWEGGLKNDSRFTSVSQDYIVNYVLDREQLASADRKWRTRKEGIDEIYREVEKLKKQHGSEWAAISSSLKKWYRHLPKGHPAYAHNHYSWVDEKGVYFPGDISWPGGGGPRYEVLHPITGKPVAVPQRGWVFAKPETMQQAIQEGRVHFGSDETSVPNLKRYLHETEGQVLPSVFYKDRRAAFKELRDILGGDGFANPKDPYILGKLIEASADNDAWILDFFAGSGTTGHAVINLNREDGGSRKYLLVEMGEYFDTVLVPRLKKVVYSKDWKDGKPQSSNTGISHAFKIVRLESYEDTLNNLRLHRTPEQEAALKQAHEADRDAYLLSYFLDVESEGSKSLLDVAEFRDPFSYKLHIAASSAGETRETTVDLVETFNWLLGLKVKTMDWHGLATKEHNDHKEKKSDSSPSSSLGSITAPPADPSSLLFLRSFAANSPGFLTVTGEKRAGGRCLILWRTLSSDPNADNTALEKFLSKLQVNPADTEFDFIYVNGPHTLSDPHNKVHLIEETFHRLMFETTNFETLV